MCVRVCVCLNSSRNICCGCSDGAVVRTLPCKPPCCSFEPDSDLYLGDVSLDSFPSIIYVRCYQGRRTFVGDVICLCCRNRLTKRLKTVTSRLDGQFLLFLRLVGAYIQLVRSKLNDRLSNINIRYVCM